MKLTERKPIDFADVAHFASFGASLDRIAAWLNVHPTSLQRVLYRARESGDPRSREVAVRLLSAQPRNRCDEEAAA